MLFLVTKFVDICNSSHRNIIQKISELSDLASGGKGQAFVRVSLGAGRAMSFSGENPSQVFP